uniref:Uncharacterized protein n=1 Tax=Urocitellus parryii TaxID=9999 RepID=A0A8D2HQ46_UROPR
MGSPERKYPIVFFDIAIKNEHLGRVSFELFADKIPKIGGDFTYLKKKRSITDVFCKANILGNKWNREL